ncbi:MAG: hypothetical protein EOP54_25905 [Sphingobacteriales bacterium]|nr:MAG: hypothetical protein EOP54_25905 [Sphingobacteriales bacterium]
MKIFTVLLLVVLSGCYREPARPLEIYTGRYEAAGKPNDFYMDISVEQGRLVVTDAGSIYKKRLDYLNRDIFIAHGFGWSLQFTRNKQHKIDGILLSGSEHLKKVTKPVLKSGFE